MDALALTTTSVWLYSVTYVSSFECMTDIGADCGSAGAAKAVTDIAATIAKHMIKDTIFFATFMSLCYFFIVIIPACAPAG